MGYTPQTWNDNDPATPATAARVNHMEAGIEDADVRATALEASVAGKQPVDTDLTAIAALDSATAGALVTDGSGWIRKTYAQLKTALSLTASDVGLGNVTNTSDANKPVSTAQQTALDSVAAAVPEQARDALGAALVAGSNVTITPDDTANTITISASGGGSSSPDSADVGYDLVLLLGQSNMSGWAPNGVDTARFDVSDPRVKQYGSATAVAYGSVISQAVEPLAMPDNPAGIGPGSHFASWYLGAVPPNRRVLLIPAAYEGTPLVSTATLGWRRGVAGNLYAQAVAQAQAALAAAGANARITVALWVQGEADADVSVAAVDYQADLDALIAGLRTDLGVPNLPFVIGQMVPEYLGSGTRGGIDGVQADTPYRLAYAAYATGPPGLNLGDGYHYSAVGLRVLGRSLFDGYLAALTRSSPLTPPDPPDSVTDAFTRADAATPGTTETGDLPWERFYGEFGISANQLFYHGEAGFGSFCAVNTGASDGTMQIKLPGAGLSRGAGVRMSSDGAQGYVLWRNNSGSYQIVRADAHVTYVFYGAGGDSSGITPGADDVLTVVLAGPSITLKVNGTVACSVTDAAYSGNTRHGVFSFQPGDVFDDFSFTP